MTTSIHTYYYKPYLGIFTIRDEMVSFIEFFYVSIRSLNFINCLRSYTFKFQLMKKPSIPSKHVIWITHRINNFCIIQTACPPAAVSEIAKRKIGCALCIIKYVSRRVSLYYDRVRCLRTGLNSVLYTYVSWDCTWRDFPCHRRSWPMAFILMLKWAIFTHFYVIAIIRLICVTCRYKLLNCWLHNRC